MIEAAGGALREDRPGALELLANDRGVIAR